MKFLARVLLAGLMLVATLSNFQVEAGGPRSLAERKDEIRQQIMQAQAARLAAYKKKEDDYFNPGRRR